MMGMMQAYYKARKRYIKNGKRCIWIKFFNLLYSCHLNEMADIGEGTQLGYNGLGCVIHDRCKIGKNCIIAQNVTIGGRDFHKGVPQIGDNVKIGAGSCILGGVIVGNNVIIGANAVVIRDIPENVIVAGVPAKIIRKVTRPVQGG